MKKLFTILCATLLSVGVFAQVETEAGTFLLSGGTGFDFESAKITTNDPDDDSSGVTEKAGSMNLDLMGGYFMMDGLAVGLAVIYDQHSWSMESNSTSASMSLSYSRMLIAPTVRYYLGETGAWFQAQYGFGSESEKEEENDGTTTETTEMSNGASALRFGAGYAIALSDNISLSPSLGYSMYTVTEKANQVDHNGYEDANGNYQDLKTTNAGLTFGLGISLYLNN